MKRLFGFCITVALAATLVQAQETEKKEEGKSCCNKQCCKKQGAGMKQAAPAAKADKKK
jgi:hypothetical protein